jgi:hypothetical protein
MVPERAIGDESLARSTVTLVAVTNIVNISATPPCEFTHKIDWQFWVSITEN